MRYLLLSIFIVLQTTVLFAKNLSLPETKSELNGWNGFVLQKSGRSCKLIIPAVFGKTPYEKSILVNLADMPLLHDIDCVLDVQSAALNQFLHLAKDYGDSEAATILLNGGFYLDGELAEEYADNYEIPILEQYKNLGSILDEKIEQKVAKDICDWAINTEKLEPVKGVVKSLKNRNILTLSERIAKKCKLTIWGANVQTPIRIINLNLKTDNTLDKLADMDSNTAWCYSSNKLPLTLEIKHSKNVQLSGIGLINGNLNDKNELQKNARVKKLSVFINKKFVSTFKIQDVDKPQWFDIKPVYADSYRLVIEDLYDGNNKVCVTEIFDNNEIMRLLDVINKIDENTINNPGGSYNTEKYLKQLIDYYQKGGRNEETFWEALSIRVSILDIKGLRLLLNIEHYLDTNGIKDVRLVESLRDMVMPFIEKDSKDVIEVLNDEKQQNRHLIYLAFYQYIEMINPNTNEDIKKNIQIYMEKQGIQ